jgi:hypothetical protein
VHPLLIEVGMIQYLISIVAFQPGIQPDAEQLAPYFSEC